MRILLIEDEPMLRQQLVERLKAKDYIVQSAADGKEGLFLGKEYPLDLAIIDLGLPKMSGLEVIKSLRRNGKKYPILILTARGQWQDKVNGLEAGADDYLVKPFHVEELFARLSALIRRAGGWSDSQLKAGPLMLDLRSQEVTINGNLVDLTAYEYKVLEYLMLHPRQIISKITLTEHLYEQDFDRDSNVIEVFVARLRKKLDPNDEYHLIETLRGRGYRFTCNPEK